MYTYKACENNNSQEDVKVFHCQISPLKLYTSCLPSRSIGIGILNDCLYNRYTKEKLEERKWRPWCRLVKCRTRYPGGHKLEGFRISVLLLFVMPHFFLFRRPTLPSLRPSRLQFSFSFGRALQRLFIVIIVAAVVNKEYLFKIYEKLNFIRSSKIKIIYLSGNWGTVGAEVDCVAWEWYCSDGCAGDEGLRGS